jgi:hypothetical protein
MRCGLAPRFETTAELRLPALLICAAALGVVGALLVLAGIVSLFRAKPLRFAARTLAGLLVMTIGALAGAIGLGMQGYQALTHEELAAKVAVRPTGPQAFVAVLRFPDGRTETFDVAGDEIYIDAHILKWKPLANFLGLHTAYELDRLAGRYRDIGQERTAPRSVHSLSSRKPVDLFELRQRHAFLAWLFDAEYGSATFVPVTRATELELRVSTSGLLMREARSPAK